MEEGEAAVEQLPDDLLLEVLARVPPDVAALFRCAVACKRWRALLADASFLRRRWPKNARRPFSFLGFFVQRPWRDWRTQPFAGAGDIGSPLTFATLTPGPAPLGSSRRRSLASFIPGLPDGELDGAQPLAARHGLLLVRLVPRNKSVPVRLAVCDPLAGTWEPLPALDRGAYLLSCAILTAADCRCPHPPPFFKVFAIVLVDGDRRPCNDLYTYSSAGPSWSEPRNCFGQATLPHDPDIQRGRHEVVVCGGVARWLVESTPRCYAMEVDADTERISLTRLSILGKLRSKRNFGGASLGVVAAAGDGAAQLALFCVHVPALRLNVWARQQDEDGGAAWVRTRIIQLKPPPPDQPWEPRSVHVWAGETSGALLVSYYYFSDYYSRYYYMANAGVTTNGNGSSSMEDVTQQISRACSSNSVVMEIDWPTLFMSRLAG